MTKASVPRICIVGESRGVGKSLLVAGLLLAFRKRGLSVSCAILGTALQQAAVYSHLIRRYVRCLDVEMLGYQGVLDAVGQISAGSDIVILDGSKGIFDGSVQDHTVPTTDLICIQKDEFPAILVFNVDYLTPSVLARVYGFTSFPDGPSFDAILFNRLKSVPDLNAQQRFQQLLRETGAPECVGYVPSVNLCGEFPQSDDCQGVNRVAVPIQLLNMVSDTVESALDLDKIIACAAAAKDFEFQPIHSLVKRGEARLAVAHDSCFSVSYQDNLDLLRLAGAEIVPFSPLADSGIPTGVGGVYLPGGCIAEYSDVLERNTDLAESLRNFVEDGGVLFSEGAGTALLAKTFRPEGSDRAYNGFGILPIHVVQDLPCFSLVQFYVTQSCILGDEGTGFNALAPSDWKLLPNSVSELKAEYVLGWKTAAGFTGREGLSVTGQSCSTFSFIHFGSNPFVVNHLLSAITAHQVSIRKRFQVSGEYPAADKH